MIDIMVFGPDFSYKGHSLLSNRMADAATFTSKQRIKNETLSIVKKKKETLSNLELWIVTAMRCNVTFWEIHMSC
jgi:hypothetical protein